MAGFSAGAFGACLTNGLESITVAKQTNPELNIANLVREQGTQLLTRGLLARVYYNGAQSLIFFSVLLGIGKQHGWHTVD